MTSPLRIDAGLREVALPAAGPSTVRVLHIAVAMAGKNGGGLWAMSVPVAAIDRRITPPRTHLVFDPALAFAVAGTSIMALTAFLGKRSGQRERPA